MSLLPGVNPHTGKIMEKCIFPKILRKNLHLSQNEYSFDRMGKQFSHLTEQILI